MNKWFLISFALLIFVSCKPQHTWDYELISFYSYLNKDSIKSDSVVLTLKSNLYAQIDKNGFCNLICFDYKGKITQLKRFQIDKKILSNALNLMDSINKDSTLVKKNCNRLYDGPTIRLIGKNKKGKLVNLSFDDSRESNLRLLLLYKYCEFNKETSTLTNDYDTLSIVKSKDSLLKKIVIKVRKSIPFIIDD